jgi:hypothetical protein
MTGHLEDEGVEHRGGPAALSGALNAYLHAPKGTVITFMLGSTGPADPLQVVVHIGEEKFVFPPIGARILADIWEQLPEALGGGTAGLAQVIEGLRLAADRADRENGVGATLQ